MKTYTAGLVVSLCVANTSAAAPAWDPYRETVDDMIARVCRNAVTTPDGGECMSTAYRLVDQELNRVYKVVTTHLKDLADGGESAQLKALKEAQRNWIKHRDGERRLQEAAFEGGTIAGEEGLRRAIEVTVDRIDDLAMRAPYALAKQVTAQQLEGRWVDPADAKHWYQFKAKTTESGEYACAGPSGSRSGTIKKTDSDWEFSASGCDESSLESILIGWTDHGAALRARFVHDGPSITARLIKQK